MDVGKIPTDELTTSLDGCMRMLFFKLRKSLLNFDGRSFRTVLATNHIPKTDPRWVLLDDDPAKMLCTLARHMAEHVLITADMMEGDVVDAWAMVLFVIQNSLGVDSDKLQALLLGACKMTYLEKVLPEAAEQLSTNFEESPEGEAYLKTLKEWIYQGLCPNGMHTSARERNHPTRAVLATPFTDYGAFVEARKRPEIILPEAEYAYFKSNTAPCAVSTTLALGATRVSEGKISLQTVPSQRVDLAREATAIIETQMTALFTSFDEAKEALFGPVKRANLEANVVYTCVGYKTEFCVKSTTNLAIIPVAVKTLKQPKMVVGPHVVSNEALRTSSVLMPMEVLVGYIMSRMIQNSLTPHIVMLYRHVWLLNLDCMLIMEQADTTLKDALCVGQSNVPRMKTLALQLLQTLMAMQALGVVHNDLKLTNIGVNLVKPDSVYVYQVDREQYLVPTHGVCLVLMDYGSARLVPDSSPLQADILRSYVGVVKAMCRVGLDMTVYEDIVKLFPEDEDEDDDSGEIDKLTLFDTWKKLCAAWDVSKADPRLEKCAYNVNYKRPCFETSSAGMSDRRYIFNKNLEGYFLGLNDTTWEALSFGEAAAGAGSSSKSGSASASASGSGSASGPVSATESWGKKRTDLFMQTLGMGPEEYEKHIARTGQQPVTGRTMQQARSAAVTGQWEMPLQMVKPGLTRKSVRGTKRDRE